MILPGQGSYINPRFITPAGDTTITGYVTDIITDLTIDWLDKKRDPAKPFLLLYLHKAPHRAWCRILKSLDNFPNSPSRNLGHCLITMKTEEPQP